MRSCLWCGSPLPPGAAPWRCWCSSRCRFRAYRARRQLLARGLEARISDQVKAGRVHEAEDIVAYVALPSLRIRLRRYLERQLAAEERLRVYLERSRFSFEKWLLGRARLLRRTGHRRPPLQGLPPEAPQ